MTELYAQSIPESEAPKKKETITELAIDRYATPSAP